MGNANDELIEHSLPGTNQAGKGARASEQGDALVKPSDEGTETIAHSLPGTNQAGKGPSVPGDVHQKRD